MTKPHQRQRVAERWGEDCDDLDGPDLVCPIVGCTLTAENSIRMRRGDVDEVVARCRVHTHPLHHLIVGPGPA